MLIDKLAMDKERDALTNENQQLRMLLKQYLDGKLGKEIKVNFFCFLSFFFPIVFPAGISVNEEVLAKDNSLLIVNSQSSLTAYVGRVCVSVCVCVCVR